MIIPVQIVQVLPGTNINDAALEICQYAEKYNCIVRFEFNGVELEAYPFTTTPEDIIKRYKRRLKGGRRNKNV